MHYIVSDGSIMAMEDFLLYIGYLKKANPSFIFTEWFSEDDFSSTNAFNYVNKILEE